MTTLGPYEPCAVGNQDLGRRMLALPGQGANVKYF